ncbi:hypothetical protein KB681_gp06 [Burkholderia phage Mica]|uniref:Uncharacterized protein n=1 Tax=Burkholderia phage Mica TaxID=2767579 RepID=A0A873WBJ0_9CAUD|nr:hypothetical protein KB681_gp06 [Burkholderia phage Mica]QPB08619.1 hypothetical protein CPT_Mica_006 [Burkholderia phage Mica]
MGFSEKVVQLKLTGAIVIDGVIARAGTLVEMVESEAKDLLRRGKAELHAILGDDDADDAATQNAAAQAAADEATASQDDAGTTPPPNVLSSRAPRKGK